jgi:hypothetical protein
MGTWNIWRCYQCGVSLLQFDPGINQRLKHHENQLIMMRPRLHHSSCVFISSWVKNKDCYINKEDAIQRSRKVVWRWQLLLARQQITLKYINGNQPSSSCQVMRLLGADSQLVVVTHFAELSRLLETRPGGAGFWEGCLRYRIQRIDTIRYATLAVLGYFGMNDQAVVNKLYLL